MTTPATGYEGVVSSNGASSVPATGTDKPGAVGFNSVTLLSLFALLLLLMPARFVVGSIGAAGTPGELLGVGLLVLWGGGRIARSIRPSPARTVQWAALLFALAVLASYLAASSRVIDGTELRSADRGILSLAAWAGIALTSAEAIPDRRTLDVVLRRVVFFGALVAVIAVIQFSTGFDLTTYLHLPGLSQDGSLLSVGGRAGFRRPAGTAISPIELGVVLAMILPIALHYAIADQGGRRGPVRRWLPVALLAFVLPLTLSRSALLGLAIVGAFLIPTWPRPYRLRSYGFIAVGLGVVFTAVPGLLGSLSGLFLHISSDSSTLSRTDSYSTAAQYISQAPVFGRGFGTFLPSYRILDDEYLLFTIEAGFFGLMSCLVLFGTGLKRARSARVRSWDPVDRSLAQSLMAAVAVAAVAFGTFDALEFEMFAGMLFLTLGCVGALDRFVTLREQRLA